ncbi:hypothetical protein T12_12301 [Trichinella patagoniensis]|uniref:Uncharacterized protein n=1 Tax=Trichinella patagoniensis TaxID=990121 RepID=A0A0V1A7X1_9BILA|nr:hypothetical protein T12_12301 [Trichinella patagoniensis]
MPERANRELRRLHQVHDCFGDISQFANSIGLLKNLVNLISRLEERGCWNNLQSVQTTNFNKPTVNELQPFGAI